MLLRNFFRDINLFFFENLSVIIISMGEIPIGFIRVNKVVRQKIKNCISCCKTHTFYILSGELMPRILNPLLKMIFTAFIN